MIDRKHEYEKLQAWARGVKFVPDWNTFPEPDYVTGEQLLAIYDPEGTTGLTGEDAQKAFEEAGSKFGLRRPSTIQ
jgi:hypothetical protein